MFQFFIAAAIAETVLCVARTSAACNCALDAAAQLLALPAMLRPTGRPYGIRRPFIVRTMELRTLLPLQRLQLLNVALFVLRQSDHN